MSISEVLSTFDIVDKKGFNTHTIISALMSLNEEEKKKSEFEYEYLAFSLVPSSNNNWGTYYGPQMTFKDENDNIFEDPALTDITIDAVLYWEQRYKITKNPLLTMTYAGLVWDFKSTIFHQKYDSDLYRIYVDSMLKVCNEDYTSHPVITTNILERLFNITKGQKEDFALLKAAYIDFEDKNAVDNSPRYWSSRFNLMLKNKKLFTQDEIDTIVQEHEKRLARMCNPVDGQVNPWNVESQAILLADYYNSLQQQIEVKRVLKCVEQAFLSKAAIMSNLQLMGNLENLYAKYRHYSLEEDAKQLSIQIQKIGINARAEMHPHEMELTIPLEVHQQAEDFFGTSVVDNKTRFCNFAVYFIPDKSKEQVSLEEQIKEFPLMFMISNKLMDSKGRPMSVIGSYKQDPEGNLIHHITQGMQIIAYFLDLAIQKMKACGGLTVDNIMSELIELSPIFDSERYAAIRKALALYFSGDYMLFCHLIIPQIENAICNLVSLSGSSVLRPQRSGTGFQLKTLDELLRDDSVIYAFKDNGAYYLRLVLTDQRALNIRNSLCHGILVPESFDVNAANRLLHVLVLLGLVRHE